MWRESQPVVTCIAMAGARSTGKSLYLAVLRGQLELWVTTQHRSHLRAHGDTDRIFDERYRRPLYQQRQMLTSTATIQDDETAQRPLIFSFKEQGGRTRALVLRDVAGEDLEDLASRSHRLEFLRRADGIVALLDPYKVESIREMLRGAYDASGEPGGDGIKVIEQLLDFLSQHREGRHTRVPFAVALSKVDALQELRKVAGTRLSLAMARAGSPLRRDPSMRSPAIDRDDVDLLDAEVRSFITFVDGPGLPNLLREHAERHRFFAVSALGGRPRGDAVPDAGIAPFRVLDPLKWILEEDT
ncbi:hypothetical protein DJ010_00880 [Nocardioides silvaticus]|uniref:Double-GTPase 2 domain-containing protein n=1 Tax=Nocardioides silvaticus TaxID=2201891 RepID=A0A316TIJ3_9ACTN|nr:hypothetical protein DJ010_00880 [Nocardioides silvaticus]